MDSTQRAGLNEEDWYNMPLYYDIIFDQETSREAEFLEQMVSLHATRGEPGGLDILEPACGSGRLMELLSGMGHRVTGFDISSAMIEFAKDRLLSAGHEARLYKMGMEGFQIPGKFDMAYCLVSTFKYLLNEEDASSHLRNVAAHLRRGGIYVLGFHLSVYSKRDRQREHWVGSRAGTRVDCTIDSDPPDNESRLENIQSTLKIKGQKGKKTVNTKWKFRTYDASQVRSLLKAIPEFKLVQCYDFCYDVNEPRELESPWEDVVLILKKVGS